MEKTVTMSLQEYEDWESQVEAEYKLLRDQRNKVQNLKKEIFNNKNFIVKIVSKDFMSNINVEYKIHKDLSSFISTMPMREIRKMRRNWRKNVKNN